MRTQKFLVLLALVFGVSALAVADTMPVVSDTYTRDLTTEVNGKLQSVAVKNAPSAVSISRRLSCLPESACSGFAQFDLSVLPAGTVVEKAQLRMWVYKVRDAGSVDVLPVLGAWDEGSLSGATAPALGSAVATVAVSEADAYGYVTVDVTLLVQDWIDGTEPNYGIAVAGNASDPVWVDFASKENASASRPMELEVVGSADASPPFGFSQLVDSEGTVVAFASGRDSFLKLQNAWVLISASVSGISGQTIQGDNPYYYVSADCTGEIYRGMVNGTAPTSLFDRAPYTDDGHIFVYVGDPIQEMTFGSRYWPHIPSCEAGPFTVWAGPRVQVTIPYVPPLHVE